MARRRACKPFSPAALDRGAQIEHHEHPEFSKTTARKIARDHLCVKGNRAYPRGALAGLPPAPHRSKRKLATGDRVVRDYLGKRGNMTGTIVKVTPLGHGKVGSGYVRAYVRVRWDNGYTGSVEDRQLEWVDDFNPRRRAIY